VLISVRDISVIVDCIIISFHYLVLIGQVNVEFLPRFNVIRSFFPPVWLWFSYLEGKWLSCVAVILQNLMFIPV
jgi:hypothetical protein